MDGDKKNVVCSGVGLERLGQFATQLVGDLVAG
jgi:hypothetical protein